jgi:NDP-sugar pyrophosphorylase family protein
VDALIFAAGLGTRLRPLTDDRPKALVEVAGVPMLEWTARRLVAAGATRLVINVCPFADAIEAFVRARGGFGVEVLLAREAPTPLETGGGLKAAAPLLRRDGPILLHNVDVWTDLPLDAMLAAHRATRPLATLAVMQRTTTRRLRFDDRGLLGRVDEARAFEREARPRVGPVVERAFAGVHVIEPRLLDAIVEDGVFGIFEPYLRLVAAGERIAGFAVDGCRWVDVGRPDDLARAHALAAAR